MTGAALLTAIVIGVSLVLLITNVATPDLVLLGGVILLVTAGVVTPDQALGGFSNTGMLTVAGLFIVAAGLRETGAITLVTSRLLGRPRTSWGALVRMAPPVALSSMFLNNTTIVAALMPAVLDWSRRIGRPASHLLIPLVYATTLGGVGTLVGTSTNLVVAGLVDDRIAADVAAGVPPTLAPVEMFSVTPVGLPVLLAGLVVVIALAPLVLPNRQPALSLADDPRHYTMELIVPRESRLAGQNVEQAGLRHLPGAYLMEIIRDGQVLPAVSGTERLDPEDRLVFVGDVEAMVDLQRLPGLAAAPTQVFRLAGDRSTRILSEAVVSHRNPIVGKSIRDGGFRNRYHAVVIAVARSGERLGGRIGDIVLRAGDTLLLEARPDFVSEQRSRSDFYLVSEVHGATPPRRDRVWIAFGILTALVASSALGLFPTVVAAFLASGLMVVTRCITLDEARKSLDVQVLVAIAASFGLGEAMTVTGLDDNIAGLVLSVAGDDPRVALAAVYIATALLTELVTNNAAAVLALPLGLAVATQVGASPTPFVFTVMIAASASFLTPIGYQTNLMVYGPGGYRATDYLRLGAPLSITVFAVTMLFAPVMWPL